MSTNRGAANGAFASVFSIELEFDINGVILGARWLGCDMRFGAARVGLA